MDDRSSTAGSRSPVKPRADGDVGRVIDLGGVPLEIVGDHPLLQMVGEELPLSVNDAVAGRITLVSELSPMVEAVGLGPVEVAGSRLQLEFSKSALSIEIDLDGPSFPFEATVGIGTRPSPHRIPRRAFRWVEPTFHTPEESQAYVFIHMVLESLVLTSARGIAPLHASVVERDGRAVVLTSAGGVGKTSTSMQLLRSPRWRFLSDDIAMIKPGHPMAPYRRLPMIYDYNVRGDVEMRRKVRGAGGMAGRAQWALAGPMHGDRRRRRISTDALYGRPTVGHGAPPSLIAFLVRSHRDRPQTRPLSAEDLTQRSVAILQTEFPHLFTQLLLAEAAGAPPIVGPLLDRVSDTYMRAFADADQILEVAVPAGPNAAPAVASLIDELLDG